MSQSSDLHHHREVDSKIWRACAGASVQIPSLYSRVYYFPQGHFEHCSPTSNSFPPSTSPVPCLVSSFHLLADPVTDEVFAHLTLQPLTQNRLDHHNKVVNHHDKVITSPINHNITNNRFVHHDKVVTFPINDNITNNRFDHHDKAVYHHDKVVTFPMSDNFSNNRLDRHEKVVYHQDKVVTFPMSDNISNNRFDHQDKVVTFPIVNNLSNNRFDEGDKVVTFAMNRFDEGDKLVTFAMNNNNNSNRFGRFDEGDKVVTMMNRFDEGDKVITMVNNSNKFVTVASNDGNVRYECGEEEKSKVVTFAKILTPSDANNGGGFSVPRYCADSVFPPLDFQADPPVQKLFITDVHGNVWDFRHIYRGTPRRHLLTTGWSKFVNSKKLIAGDSVVFMRRGVDEMFIGVRRAPVSNTGIFFDEEEDVGEVKKGFRRVGKGKLTKEAVEEAIRRASQGLEFEVVYYPTAGWSDFVVRAEDVEASLGLYWSPGTRVKMAMETEDSSRITWFQGIVSSTFQETGMWRGSPWKQLQITWDEPEILQNVKRVNPWQVEIVANPTQLHATFPPTKRVKFPHNGGFVSGEERDIFYPHRGLSNVAAPPHGDPTPHMFQYNTFPAGMQGARHFGFGSYNPTGYIGENPPQLYTNNFFSQRPGFAKVMTTEKNFGSPPSEELSPNSHSTNHFSANEQVGNRGPPPARANSFQLFGKIINVQERSESSVAESGLYDEDGSKSSSDNDTPNETRLSLNHSP